MKLPMLRPFVKTLQRLSEEFVPSGCGCVNTVLGDRVIDLFPVVMLLHSS